MEPDDLEPQKQAKPKKNLDPMSIDELEGYIAELETEIERVRGDIRKKQAHRAGADAFFKK
ncbi:MAG: DUF1192 domain-containing protein [Alphaproteobacteria bacterium]|nr:DUF1192 domain-containing protein [Alphaproteobacteria bacterium]